MSGSDYNEDFAIDDGGRFKLAPQVKKSNFCTDYLSVQFLNVNSLNQVARGSWHV